MLISLDDLIKKYSVNLKGILHVGAHHCEELENYEKYIQRDKILWIEALQDKVNYCKSVYPNVLIEQAVISDKEETVTFNVSGLTIPLNDPKVIAPVVADPLYDFGAIVGVILNIFGVIVIEPDIPTNV